MALGVPGFGISRTSKWLRYFVQRILGSVSFINKLYAATIGKSMSYKQNHTLQTMQSNKNNPLQDVSHHPAMGHMYDPKVICYSAYSVIAVEMNQKPIY